MTTYGGKPCLRSLIQPSAGTTQGWKRDDGVKDMKERKAADALCVSHSPEVSGTWPYDRYSCGVRPVDFLNMQ